MLTPLDVINDRILDRLERESFQEPREVETRCCDECGGLPDDDFLYNDDGDWVCGDCLLNRHERKDIYHAKF